MAKMETKKVFDEFFKTVSPTIEKKCRTQVDREEVYEYERKLGKQIFDMDVDELFGLIESFNRKGSGGSKGFGLSYSTYDQIASLYRKIWNFYINIEVIKNPWNDDRMRGTAAAIRISEKKGKITFADVEEAIKKMYVEYPENSCTPKYIECLLLLFYNGFANSMEIVTLKEDDINFKTHEIRLSGRTIHLSDRCFELLQYIHDMKEDETPKGIFKMVSYRGGYFKFPVRGANVEKLQEETISSVSSRLNRKITSTIKFADGSILNYRTVYLLGFYDYIVSKVGKERAEELVRSVRNTEDAHELMKYVSSYGLKCDNVTSVKKLLRPFI